MTESGLGRGWRLLELRRPAEAEVIARQQLGQHPEDFGALSLLVDAQLAQGRVLDAIATARTAARADPASGQAQLLLARALNSDDTPSLARTNEAMRAAKAAVLALPHDTAALHELARAQSAHGWREDAIATAQEVVRLAPLDPGAHNLLGFCHAALGHASRARTAYHEALRLSAGDADVLNNLAALEGNRGRLTAATGYLTAGLGSDPLSPGIQRNHDLIWMRLVQRIWWAEAATGVGLSVMMLLHVAWGVRLTTGMTFMAACAVLSHRVVRKMPRGSQRNPRGVYDRLEPDEQSAVGLLVPVTAAVVCFAVVPPDVADLLMANEAFHAGVRLVIGLGLGLAWRLVIDRHRYDDPW
ncbi:tetratricopeptide repeat protein [Nocardioides sp. LS1]|uniref:tetratricopeptide repeat protein n=1 Tax=Nocardioides sp. LS1 TaxID=1027620 RepID=UPI000F62282D|nr:tetratricopeptide repeat protein [Nocardioides sp. LS1]GCD91005.1 hypothetical protein NLS1_30110 [Nocardioides sp. LS1]